MSTYGSSLKTFAQREKARITHEIAQKLDASRQLCAQTRRLDDEIAELWRVRKYWSEVQAGIRDIEGNPVENFPRNAS